MSAATGVAAFCQVLCSRANGVDYFSKAEREGYAKRYVKSIIDSPHPTRCIDNYRMCPESFKDLCERVRPNLRTTKQLSVEVMVAIYLQWLGHYPTYRQQKETFRVSHGSIKKAKHRVRLAILREMHGEFVKMPDSIPDLSQHPKFKYFQGAYGCLDGSHIPIEVEANVKENFMNRKKFVSTNALLISDIELELLINYALFGPAFLFCAWPTYNAYMSYKMLYIINKKHEIMKCITPTFASRLTNKTRCSLTRSQAWLVPFTRMIMEVRTVNASDSDKLHSTFIRWRTVSLQ